MPAFTVQTLIDRAAAIADMHGDFATATQWISWLNTESRALELFVVRSGWVEPNAATVDAASYVITVPNPLAILGVYEVRDGKYRPLTYKSQPDFVQQDNASPGTTGDAYYYTAISSSSDDNITVHMYPKPTSGTYRCLYLAGATPVTALTDSVRWPMGFEERIVLGMARHALVKENSDSRQIEQLMVEQDRTIEAFCWSRNLVNSPTVRNTDKINRGWFDYMTYGSFESWLWL